MKFNMAKRAIDVATRLSREYEKVKSSSLSLDEYMEKIGRRTYPKVTNDIARVVDQRGTGSGGNGVNGNSERLELLVKKGVSFVIDEEKRSAMMRHDASMQGPVAEKDLVAAFPDFDAV